MASMPDQTLAAVPVSTSFSGSASAATCAHEPAPATISEFVSASSPLNAAFCLLTGSARLDHLAASECAEFVL